MCYNWVVYRLCKGGNELSILKIDVGDVLELKKPHPCGNKLFKVLRVGSDVRILCQSCGRDMTLDRVKLEKAVKSIKND